MTIAGTTDGVAGQTVALRCYYGAGQYVTLGGTVTLDADGNFRTEAAPKPTQRTCVLRATPNAYVRENGIAPFVGPTVGFAYSRTYTRDAVPAGYSIMSAGLGATHFLGSMNACGFYGDLYTKAFTAYTSPWDCDAYVTPWEPAVQEPGIAVDGHPAYTPDAAAGLNSTGPGRPAFVVDRAFDPLTGQWTITETDPLVNCVADGDVVDGDPFDRCPAFAPSGASLVRTTTETDEGRVVSFVDTFTSTDGDAHTLRAYYENDFAGPSLKFPGDPGYDEHGSGTTVTFGDQSSGTIYTESNSDRAPGPDNTQGALTYTTAPTRGVFAD